MSLLTAEEYKAIAAGLSYPTTAFIDGHFRPAIKGATFDTINPATGAVLAKVAACGPEDVDLAVAKARDAFEDGRWSRLHPKERKETLIRLAKLVKRNAREPGCWTSSATIMGPPPFALNMSAGLFLATILWGAVPNSNHLHRKSA